MTGMASCKNKEQQPTKAAVKHMYDVEPGSAVPQVSIINDTLIKMLFTQENLGTIAAAQAHINGDQPITCEVTISKADSLHALLVPENEDGNIRFTQIILPDGKKDGPFGKDLQVSALQTGTYQLIIGENKMAGEKWKGKFKVKVWVE